jgi:tetraacyldisaccharide 4'-kinase
MQLVLDEAVELVSGQRRPLRQFAKSPVHALAGIGDPQRFFGALRDAGLTVDAHPFADHHAFVPADLAALNRYPLLMTEKDAVKCAAFATPNQWYVPVSAEFEPAAAHAMRQWLDSTLERLHLAPK